MADVQNQFVEFHDAIKLDDENEILRQKREIILDILKKRIKEQYPDAPSFQHFVQGSYAMSTGIKPVNGDYDIDVGLSFNMAKEDHEPVEAKEWVYESLKGHTNDVEIKTPCVRVTYSQDEEPIYHVDLAVYSASNPDDKTYLAKGRPGSQNKFWEASDPKGFISLVKEHYDDTDDRAQFRRIIRYLKRWKNLKFETGGHAAPTGIALTVCALRFFSPERVVDPFANTRAYKDLKALKGLASAMLNAFVKVPNDDGTSSERLIVNMPTPPGNDLFEKMTDSQMASFKERLTNLLESSEDALEEVDPVEACRILQKQFGEDFPVPPKEDTGQKRKLAVTTHSSSASRYHAR